MVVYIWWIDDGFVFEWYRYGVGMKGLSGFVIELDGMWMCGVMFVGYFWWYVWMVCVCGEVLLLCCFWSWYGCCLVCDLVWWNYWLW